MPFTGSEQCPSKCPPGVDKSARGVGCLSTRGVNRGGMDDRGGVGNDRGGMDDRAGNSVGNRVGNAVSNNTVGKSVSNNTVGKSVTNNSVVAGKKLGGSRGRSHQGQTQESLEQNH